MRKHVLLISLFGLIAVLGCLTGCPNTQGVSGHYTIEVGSQARMFRLFVPSSYDSAEPMPLVIALHGLNMNADMLATYTGLEDTAEREGFVVAFPYGELSMWRTMSDGDALADFELLWSLVQATDDLAFLTMLMDTLESVMNIDKTRIYVCGISNGGIMSYLTALKLSDRIAAAASIAAPMPKEYALEPAPAQPVPILIMAGTEDPVLPYDGGEAQLSGILLRLMFDLDLFDSSILDFLSIDDVAAYWANVDGAVSTPVVENLPDIDPTDGTTVVRETYGGGENGSEVVIYTIEGGGHTWPGSAVSAIDIMSGRTCYDINANDVLWEFFQRFQRQ